MTEARLPFRGLAVNCVMSLRWTAWKNGSPSPSGAGYGFKVPIADREAYFDRSWRTITLELPTSAGFEPLEVNIDKPSFWNDTCHELIHKGIGRWLLQRGLAPWPRGAPPVVLVEVSGDRRFRVVG